MKLATKAMLAVGIFTVWLLVKPYLIYPYKINERSPNQIYRVELREKYAPRVVDSDALYTLYLKASKGSNSLTGLDPVPIGAWGKPGGMFSEKESRFGEDYPNYRWDSENVISFRSQVSESKPMKHDVVYLHNATDTSVSYMLVRSPDASELFLVIDLAPRSFISFKPSKSAHIGNGFVSLVCNGGFTDRKEISKSYMYFGVDPLKSSPTNYCITIQKNGTTILSEESAGAKEIEYDPASNGYGLTKDLTRRVPRASSCQVPSTW
jgi:hypothetical protein